VPALKHSGIRTLGGARLRFFSVGARHAVPGERTWRDRAICRGVKSESRGKTFVAAWCVDGARVRLARSGTACRAPTVGNGKGERAGRVPALQNNDADASLVCAHPACRCLWRRLKPTLLEGAFAVRRKRSPGLEVQLVFQRRTCTFALAVENFGRRARQMWHLPSTVATGTGGFQFETNVLFRWPSLACTSISTGSTATARIPEEAPRNF
jgi:hypothetical protein